MQDAETGHKPNRAASYILFLVIAGAPLPFGSRDAITVAGWCFLLGLGLVLTSPSNLRRGPMALLGGLGFIVACYGFVLHEQLTDHPWLAAPNPIWAKAAELLGHAVKPSVSVLRGEPFYALGPSLAAILAVTLGLLVGADKTHTDRALLITAWSGAAYAAYGLAMLLLGVASFFTDVGVQPNYLTATFINRNTAAAYLGSCAVIWLVLLMKVIRQRLPPGPIVWSQVLQNLAGKSPREQDLVIALCGFFLCLSAMFMTASRGGSLVSLFVMVLVVTVFFRRDLPRWKTLAVMVVGAATTALILLQLIGGQVEARIDSGGLADQGRYAAYQSTLRIIADNPWFGTGLGTFAAVFPAYRSGNISIVGVWDIAHSTPLELAAELGIPLTAVITIAWLVALLILLQGARRSRRETVVPIAALGVSLIALLHSSIDFSLQVPGYAIVVFALVGVGLAQSFQYDSSSGGRRRRRRAARIDDELHPSVAGAGARAGNDDVTANAVVLRV